MTCFKVFQSAQSVDVGSRVLDCHSRRLHEKSLQHFDCNYVGFYVNGQSMPNHPLQPNYKSDQYVEAFQTLNKGGKTRAVQIKRKDYKNGYCLYVIEPHGVYREDRLPQRGHTRLELKFGKSLPETVTVIAYAKFPALAKIDQSRNVILT
jgi:hypothetical protein